MHFPNLKKIILVNITFLFLFGGIGFCQDFPILKGEYMGQKLPDSIPEIFAPGIISVEDRYEYGLAISPDGNEIFFTASSPGLGLMVTRQINGKWTEPKAANLRGNNSWEFEAFYTVDGQKVYFSSHPGDLKSRLWFAEKDSTGWNEAKLLDSPINSKDVFWATFTSDFTMYYTNIKEAKIYKSKLENGMYQNIMDVGFSSAAHPFVSPDESYMLFNSKGDIYISYHQDNDKWSDPILLNDKINTSFLETCPSLSPDGEYIFFSRYNDIENKSDIYWVRSNIIKKNELKDIK